MVTVNISLPDDELSSVDADAAMEGRSRSNYIAQVLRHRQRPTASTNSFDAQTMSEAVRQHLREHRRLSLAAGYISKENSDG